MNDENNAVKVLASNELLDRAESIITPRMRVYLYIISWVCSLLAIVIGLFVVLKK